MSNQNNGNKTEDLREFFLSSWAVQNGTSVLLLTLMILLFGVAGYNAMPKEQFPEISLPTVFINTPYFGNSAPDIENLVTRPIEKELQSLEGVKYIKSTSVQDYSVITVEFDASEDLDKAIRKTKDAVDKAKSDLPSDLDRDPEVIDVNFSELPIVSVNISGDYPNTELREYAEYLQEKLEEIDEVSEAQMKGALEREVKVDLDLPKMQGLRVSYGDVEQAISSENLTLSAGELVKNDFRRAIRVKGQFESISEIEDLVVKSKDLQPIYLRDIGTVTFGYKDKTSIARSDRLPVISLDIIKRKGKNLLKAAEDVKTTIEEARPNLPSDLKITLFNDLSIQTRDGVNNLENSIISGVILVVLVLLFFLGLRNASFVGLAIPLSMLMGILLLSQSGVTMNMVVLFALILALGMLVDNAIVVVENIYRYMQEGYSHMDAARYGAGEVALPIIASTATTLAAFVPLAFWPGLSGEFMFYLPFTLILVLSSSLFIALCINPVFTSIFMKVDSKAEDPAVRKRKTRNMLITIAVLAIISIIGHFASVQWIRNLAGLSAIVAGVNFFLLRDAAFFFQNRILPVLERGYDNFIRKALNWPIAIFLGTFLLMILAIAAVMIRTPKIIDFPQADPTYVNAFIELPLGTDIEATNLLVKELEERMFKAIDPYISIVDAVLTQIGENTSDPSMPPEPGASPHKARITVSFIKTELRGGISTFEVMDKIREAMQGYPGIQIAIDKNAEGPPSGKPINLEIQGEDVNEIITIGTDVINYFNGLGIAGIEELQTDMSLDKPELIVNIDRQSARRYGLSTGQIASTLRTAVFGKEVSKFKDGEDEYPIFVRLDEKYRYDVDKILNQRITFRNNSGQMLQIPISAVASVEYSSTYTSIKRKDLERVLTVYSNVVGGYNPTEIVNELKDAMELYELPEGYTYEFTGGQEQLEEDMNFLVSAFSVAIFAILIILVTQFNSLLSPIVIVLCIFFSTIGVFLGYAFTGEDISVILSGVGIVSLAGIVVNNAIVLMDYVNLLIGRKRKELGVADITDMSHEDIQEAIIQGGATRLRPVLLTAITTVLGLIPLAIGFNFNFFTMITHSDPQIFIGGDSTAFWGPMAWTIIYGLIFATFLTLVVVPVMYWLAYRFKAALVKLFK